MPDSVGGPVYAPAAGSVMERVRLAAHVEHAVRLTGQRLPSEPSDGYEDEPGRRGHEVGPTEASA